MVWDVPSAAQTALFTPMQRTRLMFLRRFFPPGERFLEGPTA
jgi:hypothetical protein